MNVLSDLGMEVVIVPALWAILVIAVLVQIFRSFSREAIEVEEGVTIKKTRLNKKRLGGAGITFLVGTLVISSLVVVPPGHRGAIYTADGVNLEERHEGYSLMVPLIWNANMVNVREQKYENLEVYAQTKDGLEVTTQVGVNYLIRPDQAADIFQEVGQNYEATIIAPAVLGLVKREIGKIEAEQLFFQRGTVEDAIYAALGVRLDQVGIDVTFVALQDTIFDPDIVAEFLAKEAARQQQVTSERQIVVADNEAAAVVERAEGDAAAQERIAEAEDYERELLDMTPEQYLWYKVWNGVLPQFVGGGGSLDFILDSSVLNSSGSDSGDADE